MKLFKIKFKIKNKGLRFLAGMAVMLVVIAIVLSAFWAVGYGVLSLALSLGEKFLKWGIGSLFPVTLLGRVGEAIWLGVWLGAVSVFGIFLVLWLGYGFIKCSKALGNKLFNSDPE